MPPPSKNGSLLTCCSVTKSCLTLRPQRLQHTWLLCLSLSPGVCSTESIMLFNHLILCYTLILLTSIFPSIGIFSNKSAPLIRWPKYWNISFGISPSNEYSELISLGLTGWISLQCSGLSTGFTSIKVQKHQFFSAQLSLWSNSASIHYYWKNHSFHCMDLCQKSDVFAF